MNENKREMKGHDDGNPAKIEAKSGATAGPITIAPSHMLPGQGWPAAHIAPWPGTMQEHSGENH